MNNGVMTIKPGQISHSSLHREEFTFGEHPRKPTIWNARLNSNSDTVEVL
jgi:hypothetical protein